ncbi:hypothetical protein [Nocardia sp. XZ_19_369]|uniref:hypothetical protein n=1 Tax=Nocardia sp. XZ_19_369 TaxID=2769487 RepID=UPI00188DE8FB|nr:hypothetical protein [Nocardia sp. XZ_19_369]
MSGVIFTTRNRTSSVHGSERAYGLHLAIKLTVAVLDLDSREGVQRAREFLPVEAFMQFPGDTGPAAAFKRWASAGSFIDDSYLTIGDTQEPIGEVVLNTGIAVGSDAVALLTRLHGSAEDGLYVAAADQQWLAHIITEGRRANILRQGKGWESVVAHLSEDPGSDVLITSSHTDVPRIQLRATGAAHEETTGDEWDRITDEWKARPETERWDQSIDAIRNERNPDGRWWLTLAPDTFHKPAYRKGLSMFDAVLPAPEPATAPGLR